MNFTQERKRQQSNVTFAYVKKLSSGHEQLITLWQVLVDYEFVYFK